MSNQDANVAVVVNGDTSQLRSDLKRGAKSLESFEDRAKRMQKQLLKVTTATAAAASVLGVALFKSSAQSAKEIQNLSRVSGIGAEKFQKLTFAAKSYGVEQDKLSDILKDTNDKVGDFLQTGGGALADYFENIAPKIGQTADEFKNLSSHQALQKYVNGLEKANVSQAEMTFYMEAIASDATMLLPLLRNNGEEFAKVAKNIDEMGSALSDIELEELSRANKAFVGMQEAVSGLVKQIAVELAPVIENISNAFTNWIKESGGLRNKVEELKSVFNALVNVGKAIALVYGSKLVSSMLAFTGTVTKAALSTNILERRLIIASVAANTMTKATVALKRAMAFLGGQTGLIIMTISSLFMFSNQAKDTARDSDKLNDELERMETNFDGLTKAGARVALLDIGKPISEAAKNVAVAQKEYDDKLKKLKNINDSYLQSMETFQTYMSAGYQKEAIIHGEHAESIKATIPSYQAALDRSNLVLENAIAEEARLLKEKARLTSIASGKTEFDDNAKSNQEKMEAMKSANDAIIAEQKRLNSEIIKSIDIEALERKYSGYYERRHQSQQKANDKLLEDHKKALDEMELAETLNWKQRTMLAVNFASQMFGNIASLMNTENKKQFKLAKALNIAQATMDGITAAVGAFKVGSQIGGPIVGGAFALASAATTAGMINQIASQQYGGGAKTPNVSSATPSTPQGANAGQTLTVQGLDSSSLFSGNAVADLADRLLDFQRDGGRVVLGA